MSMHCILHLNPSAHPSPVRHHRHPSLPPRLNACHPLSAIHHPHSLIIVVVKTRRLEINASAITNVRRRLVGRLFCFVESLPPFTLRREPTWGTLSFSYRLVLCQASGATSRCSESIYSLSAPLSAPLPALELATMPILESKPTTNTMHKGTSGPRLTIPFPGRYMNQPTAAPPPSHGDPWAREP